MRQALVGERVAYKRRRYKKEHSVITMHNNVVMKEEHNYVAYSLAWMSNFWTL